MASLRYPRSLEAVMAQAKGGGRHNGKVTSTLAESPIERTARAAAVEAEAELASLLAEIREHERAISARFYDLGLALKRIADRKLYGVRDHASLAALLRAEKLMSARQAIKLI
jgi:hypothetical protein